MSRFTLIFLFLFCFHALSADTFFCPMKCEGQKTYRKSGDCPVCGMNLEKVSEETAALPLNSRDYRIELSSQGTTTTFSPRRTKDNSILTALEISEGSKMDVVMVSQDLRVFDHQRLMPNSSGTFQFERKFSEAGNYLLYVGITPVGDRPQVFPLAFQIEGKKTKDVPLSESKNHWKEGEIEVHVKVSAPLVSGKPIEIQLNYQKNHKPFRGLSPHAVLVSEDTTQFVLAHAKGSQKQTLHAVFPKPGLYKGWFETQIGNRQVTPTFVFRVN